MTGRPHRGCAVSDVVRSGRRRLERTHETQGTGRPTSAQPRTGTGGAAPVRQARATVAPPGLKLSEELVGRVAILALHGEFDLFTTPGVDRAIDTILLRGPRRLVVDLSHVCFLDSAGLEVLVAGHRRAGPRTDLRIVATTRATWRPLQIGRLHETLVIHTSCAAAIAAPARGSRAEPAKSSFGPPADDV
ncbi:STAS domain-containing protein [Amycolatopsis jiangsuensis]|uniref:Anti-anti-sigma factor n=1 Tax=Amycolatopsis jiangsuensis TaxID=1181879 RepID=A0A840J426_9PSEU|nr:STAS domain-containing protein [Amycolatopsis jiangsuensis]MBB4688187.1 anti-anti-sigma factor [Amycolatopsis jiangsuensis]